MGCDVVRVVLQAIKYRPAIHHGQPDIEDDRIWLEFSRQLSLHSTFGDETLEVCCRAASNRIRKVDVILNNQKHAISWLDPLRSSLKKWLGARGWRVEVIKNLLLCSCAPSPSISKGDREYPRSSPLKLPSAALSSDPEG